MFVYVIVNDVDWKIYIGKTTRPNLRQYLQKKFWYAAHRPALHSHLYAAIRKYGKENFHIHPLISNLQTDEELGRWEQVLIKCLAAQNPAVGYNICREGEGFTGPQPPKRPSKKIAHASEEMWKRPETKNNYFLRNAEKRRGIKRPLHVIEAAPTCSFRYKSLFRNHQKASRIPHWPETE